MRRLLAFWALGWALGFVGCGDRFGYRSEVAAIRSIRVINKAETIYWSEFGGYASSLTELGPPAGRVAGPSSADLLGHDLATGVKQGYKFTLTLAPGGYQITATPENPKRGSGRSFYSDQTLIVRSHYGSEPANANSEDIAGPTP